MLKASGNKRAFVIGPITLKRGVTLVVDTNAIVFASRDPRQYDLGAGPLRHRRRERPRLRALITAERATGSGVMGPGTIDGRGWAKLLGKDVSWWDLAQDAKVRNLSQSCPRLMQINRSDDFTLYKITLKNSPNFHVVYDRGNGFTAWGVVINTADKRARNTDGIDPASATNVTITHSYINTGDDDVAIKAGNTGPSSNITISHNHFYRGHGVSIGSETDGGAHAIRVFDLSIDGADNGLRIKSNASRGGLVHDIEYRDVCIRNTKNVIEMDTHYTASAQTTGQSHSGVPRHPPQGRARRRRRQCHSRRLRRGASAPDGVGRRRFRQAGRDQGEGVARRDRERSRAVESRDHRRERAASPERRSDAPRLDCERKFVPLPANAARDSARRRRLRGDRRRDASRAPTAPWSTALRPTTRSASALTSLPANGAARAIVFVRNGRYREKLTIDRPRVTLLGESRDGAVLTFDAASDTPTPTGGSYGTRGSFTLRIVAPDFRAENMTIENAFDYPANAAKPDSDKTKFKNPQAVALMTDLGSDRAVFANVKITGYQDTLFPNSGRSYFYKCEVWGHVDFIFGAGQAVFDDCDIVSRDRGSKTNNGYVDGAEHEGRSAVRISFRAQPTEEGERHRCRRTPSRSAGRGIRSPTRP